MSLSVANKWKIFRLFKILYFRHRRKGMCLGAGPERVKGVKKRNGFLCNFFLIIINYYKSNIKG